MFVNDLFFLQTIFSKANIFVFHEYFHRVKWPLRITSSDSTPVVMRKENSETSHRGPLSHGQDQNWDPKTARLSCDLRKPEIETF